MFKRQDTTETFSIVIGKGFPANYTFDQYNFDLFDVLKSKHAIIIDSASNLVETNAGRSFLY